MYISINREKQRIHGCRYYIHDKVQYIILIYVIVGISILWGCLRLLTGRI